METLIELIILIAEDDDGHFELITEKLLESSIHNKIIRFKNGEEAWHFLSETGIKEISDKSKSYLLLLDINMPKMSGIEVSKIIDGKMPWIKIIALSMYSHPQYIKAMLRQGAKGFLSKNCLPSELFEAIRAVQEGKTYLDKHSSEVILHDYTQINSDSNADLNPLTAREIEIIRALADGMVTREISAKLFISEKTVERHKTNILKKLGLRNTAQLIKVAVEQGLLIQ